MRFVAAGMWSFFTDGIGQETRSGSLPERLQRVDPQEVIVVAIPYVYAAEQHRDHNEGHCASYKSALGVADRTQDSLTAELAEEQERNAGHLAEIDSLQKEYDDKLATFEVSRIALRWENSAHCPKASQEVHGRARQGVKEV